MSFEVACPGCRKSYTADAKMVGKRIRCRQCSQIFLVESSEASSSSSTLGREASRVMGPQSGTRTAAGAASVISRPPVVQAPPHREVAQQPKPKSDPFGLRPSEPQPFPGSLTLEAWVPLGLYVMAAVWITTETFSDNASGAAWAPIVRILAFAALYFLLVVPATLFAAKKAMGRLRLAMPPSAIQRIIATFILPATLAYIFAMLSGIIGFVIGSVVGLAVVAVVFWLLFRIESQETASAYTVVGGTYLGASVVGALLLTMLAMLLNHSLSPSASANGLHENPLGPEYAWTKPPLPTVPSHERGHDSGPSNSTPSSPGPTASVAGPQAPAVPPVVPEQPEGTSSSSGTTMVQGSAKTTPDDTEADPALQSGLFGQNAADADAFVKSIQEAKLPWVKWAYRPSDQGIYEQSLSPLATSPVVALFRLPGIGGRTIECCRLSPTYRGLGALPLGDEGADATAIAGRFAITEDGSTLLRLTNSAAPKVEVLPFRGPGTSVSLTCPAEFGNPQTPRWRPRNCWVRCRGGDSWFDGPAEISRSFRFAIPNRQRESRW